MPIELRGDQQVVEVLREPHSRGWVYTVGDRHGQLFVASQRLNAIARLINEHMGDEHDRVSVGALYEAVQKGLPMHKRRYVVRKSALDEAVGVIERERRVRAYDRTFLLGLARAVRLHKVC